MAIKSRWFARRVSKRANKRVDTQQGTGVFGGKVEKREAGGGR